MLKNRMSTSAFRTFISSPRRYPAAALALAAVGVGVAPLTASAATAPAKPATAHVAPASVKATASTAKATAASTTKTTTKTTTTPAKATAKAATPTSLFAGSTTATLEPTGTVGSQSHITLDSDQWSNATSIVKAAEDMHLSPYAATIAVATSMQESKLQNLNVAVDHDSLGLFQQRPSCGWGTPSQLNDPTYAAKAFLKNLPSGYQSMSLHRAAQDVQDSFNGSLYSQWEDQAAHIVSTIVNH
ncbi:hypothetical protein [Actinospica robiniae]|uniref:hypothetical protein n=1 Tax=Actinospica robiniae TaxID=304901 RepID=UPI000424827C|nr:hypothetical protein [Actinospica robiniae]